MMPLEIKIAVASFLVVVIIVLVGCLIALVRKFGEFADRMMERDQ